MNEFLTLDIMKPASEGQVDEKVTALPPNNPPSSKRSSSKPTRKEWIF
jgi:hypothetical protein